MLTSNQDKRTKTEHTICLAYAAAVVDSRTVEAIDTTQAKTNRPPCDSTRQRRNGTQLITRYDYLWERNPLWLAHIPGIPDPRRQPHDALRAARAMLAGAMREAVAA